MYCFIKRLLDIIFSLVAIILLWWLFIIIYFAVKKPVLFKQVRVGQHNKPFTIYKFRTMLTSTPEDIPTDCFMDAQNYITKLGGFLRTSSLDELPQLFNILKGDMSFVGPRPALFCQYELIAMRDALGASALKPGLTGLAQVNSRDELTTYEKATLDGRYTTTFGFITDLKIIFKSFSYVFNKKGITQGVK